MSKSKIATSCRAFSLRSVKVVMDKNAIFVSERDC